MRPAGHVRRAVFIDKISKKRNGFGEFRGKLLESTGARSQHG